MFENLNYRIVLDFEKFLKKDGVLAIEDPSLSLDETTKTYAGTNQIALSYLDVLATLGYNVMVFDNMKEYEDALKNLNIPDMGCKEGDVCFISNKHIKEELLGIEDIGRVLGIKDLRE